MIPTDRQIMNTVNAGEIEISPFDQDNVQGASIDLRVGSYGTTSTTRQKINIKSQGFLILEPGAFAVIEIMEVIKLTISTLAELDCVPVILNPGVGNLPSPENPY